MVKFKIPPPLWIMALLTFFALLPFMYVIEFVTGVTVIGRFTILVFRMTVYAFDCLMLTGQPETGFIMPENHIIPAPRLMTGSTTD